MLNRQLGDLQGSGKYVDFEVGWLLDGRLPFAYMIHHDDEVRKVWWEGGDLVFAVYFQGYEDAAEERIRFVDARVVAEDGWFAAPRIWWEDDELGLVDGGYEVRISGMDSAGNRLPADSHVAITLRARDIVVVNDGRVIEPHPGHLPEYMLVAALNENAPAERRAEAKRRILARESFYSDWLVHPLGRKACWEGCAEVLYELDDEALSPLLPDLLEWLIDLNWPGAQKVFARLSRMRPELLAPALGAAERRARAEDAEWLGNLARLEE